MGIIIDVKALTNDYQVKIIKKVTRYKENTGKDISLAVLQVASDGGSTYYRKSVSKLCEKLLIKCKEVVLEDNASEEEVINEINKLNSSEEVNGVLFLLPLPKHLDAYKIKECLSPLKDIDGITTSNAGKFYMGEDAFAPCTPLSVIEILKSLDVNLSGMNAVIIGRSNVVGKPLAELLLRENCTVTITHSRTKDISSICKNADILISAIGQPKFVDDSFVRNGAIVIDVGTSNVDGKMTGDVDLEKVLDKVSFATKVPGGVGSLTTTILLNNLCEELK